MSYLAVRGKTVMATRPDIGVTTDIINHRYLTSYWLTRNRLFRRGQLSIEYISVGVTGNSPPWHWNFYRTGEQRGEKLWGTRGAVV